MTTRDNTEPVDYAALYEAANYRFGIENVTDKTYDTYPLPDTWKPIEDGIYKFEIDIQNTDTDEETVRDVLNAHGYSVWQKQDNRYDTGRSPHKFIAVVTDDSEPLPHDHNH